MACSGTALLLIQTKVFILYLKTLYCYVLFKTDSIRTQFTYFESSAQFAVDTQCFCSQLIFAMLISVDEGMLLHDNPKRQGRM
jgi:hypothetical protein